MTNRKNSIKRKLIFFAISVPIIFSYVVFVRAPQISESRKKNISEFKLNVVGVITDKKALDHNDALCRLSVISSNMDKFEGEDYIGRKITMKNDTIKLTLMNNHCLEIGDTIEFGPKDNYIIRNKMLYFDRHKQIDDCYKLGRE